MPFSLTHILRSVPAATLRAYLESRNAGIPEAWWVLEGEQCLQTTRTTIRAGANQGAIVAEGDTMRMVGTGTGPRRALVLILHDADKPGGFTLEKGPALKSCS